MAKSRKRIGTWIILGLLFVGLMGFGATGLSGSLRSIGSVGDKEIRVTDYARELTGQIRAFEAQTGQPLPFADAQAFGIDRFALSRLVALRALDNEVSRLGLSVGDTAVAEQVLSIPAFRDLQGNFDREAYDFALDRQGLNEAEFEASIREEIARTFLQGAVEAGVPEPDAYAAILARFAGESRDIRYIRLTPDLIDLPAEPPRPGDLEAFHAANPERFTAPEVKRIDYVWLTPDMLQDSVEVDEEALRALYETRSAEFNRPERRLVDRLGMPDAAAAEDALAQIAVGAATFDTLVAERGIRLDDIDLGDVTETDLGAAGAGVFAAGVGEVVGPLPSDIGPALFRINAILDATEIGFEDALPDLREELAAERARRVIDQQRETLSDLIAGGADIAELAAETDLEAGQIDFSEGVADGIAAYSAFRDAAAAARPGDFLELFELEDGGVFALAVTEVVPPQLRPFEEVEDEVLAAWVETEIRAELDILAERYATLIIETGDFTAEMPEPETATGLTRRSFLADLPPGLVEEVFGISPGGLAMVEEGDLIVLARLEAVHGADADDPDVAARAEAIGSQAGAAMAADLMSAFMTRIQERTEVALDQAAITAVHSQLQ